MTKRMKIDFEDLDYQHDAVDAIANIFDGAVNKSSIFTVEKSIDKPTGQEILDIDGEGITYDLGYGNRLSLSDSELLENVRLVQERNGIEMSSDIQNNNFTVEMETGTGKTYVYIKSILELNKKYGFTKFIIVVPSIAIREGVYKSLQITEDHFKVRYSNVTYDYFVYESNKLDDIHNFSTSTNIQIMIINIDAFRKTFNKRNAGNIIHRQSEKLSGNRPIDLIASTNPLLIIDEPQSVDNTEKSKEAIRTLNPLATLRFSATHKQIYNLIYRLTPVDAYQKNLVKRIEVSSVLTDGTGASPFIKLISTNRSKERFSARVLINSKKKDGSIKVVEKVIYNKDDLWELSNYVEYYQGRSYILEGIGIEKGNEYITFLNGVTLGLGEAHGDVSEDALKRAQIRETIKLHLEKEFRYLEKGIKVLSLFFIDKVHNYREYDEHGNPSKGIYAKWFEEEYLNIINSKKYSHLKEKYRDKLIFDVERIHDGYFSVDNKGRIRDTKGESNADANTYELIMKEKERLLDLAEPLRFIFSHSALKEGWDNPNVFQVCTLVDTKDELTKRQKIGRGLRLAVDQAGGRVNDQRYNILSIIANESYKEFSKGLQQEFEKEAGYQFNIVNKFAFSGKEYIDKNNNESFIKQAESIGIHKSLQQFGYIDKNGKITSKFSEDVINNEFEINEKYKHYESLVINTLERASKEIEILDADREIKIKINEKILLSDDFLSLWNKINRRTIYSIDMDIESFKKSSIIKISQMKKIEKEVIRTERTSLNVSEAGVDRVGKTVTRSLGSTADFSEMLYPDFIRRIQDSTGLLRSTIIDILKKSKRIADFKNNPEEWIKEVARLLNIEKKKSIANGINYYSIEDEYYQLEEIFNDKDLIGYEGKNAFPTPNKHIYNYVLYDSVIERQFAEAADEDSDIKMFAKLPKRFLIDTPYGKYNPDWVMVVESSHGEKVYFVAETKGAKIHDNRISEDGKIMSATKHFQFIDPEIKYEVIKELKEIKLKV